MSCVIPENYCSHLTLRETEQAIKKVKDFFERDLAIELNLTRVSAPLFVDAKSGMNDNLNGTERPVSFDVFSGEKFEIVHSLAKWKRYALKMYGFEENEGLYTDMNAIRRDEETDNIHSIFVDQWDWEKIIPKESRNEHTLKKTVKLIYSALRHTEYYITKEYNFIGNLLPEKIHFVSSFELEEQYPNLSRKEREYAAAKEYGAIFLMKIGGALKDGKPHDGRAPDYDDWTLNGDILFWDDVLDCAVEVSSMGIRVDPDALDRQLTLAHCDERRKLPYHKALLAGELPLTIGGGIGQSRLSMLLLGKAHIGEVQASIWDEDTMRKCAEAGIMLL